MRILPGIAHLITCKHTALKGHEGSVLVLCRRRWSPHIRNAFYLHPNENTKAWKVPSGDVLKKVLTADTTADIMRVLIDAKAEMVSL